MGTLIKTSMCWTQGKFTVMDSGKFTIMDSGKFTVMDSGKFTVMDSGKYNAIDQHQNNKDFSMISQRNSEEMNTYLRESAIKNEH